jgi:putative ATPase
LGHGKGYKYSHDFPDAFAPQAYLPEGRVFYEPSDRGEEKRIAERLAHWRSVFEAEKAKDT